MGEGDRRPLASRNTQWARALAGRMAAMSVTPNAISQASMVMAALAAAAFWIGGESSGGMRSLLLVSAAAFCQLRLLCNLLDGMVAVEGGKGEADGPFWNEFPDRVADVMILAGLGCGIGMPALGWAAAAFALMTAYVRELGRANGAPSDFSGPMAKQHRMALVTVAALLSSVEFLWNGDGQILMLALWIIVIGAGLTALRRAYRQIGWLRANRAG